MDGLSLLIGFLASGVGVLILTYSGGYMHGEPGKAKYYTALLAFMGSMLGVAFSADLISLFVFWELTSLSSFILIGHYTDRRSSQYAARKSMLITVSGGLFMLIGFILINHVAGTFAMFGPGGILTNAAMTNEQLHAAGLFVPALALIAVGAAAKSAQVPLHIWLPNAMEAPTPVSAFLHSATMVKAGVYLIGRFRPLFLPEEIHAIPDWMLLFAVLGLATMTITAILAVAATDIKELLAYSTASHLGLIVAGFGFASEYGAETGAFHILNHAMFKAALFLVAGIIAHEAGTRKIKHLGGLWRNLPITAAITVVAALGMAGVPPFNGFYSKEFLFESAYHAAEIHGGLAWLFPVVAVFGSVFTFLYSIRFLMLFFGEKPKGLGHVHRPPLTMLVPPAILGTIAALIGLGGVTDTFGVAPAALNGFVGSVVESTLPPAATAEAAEAIHFSYHLPTSLTPAATMSAITIGIGLVAYQYYDDLHRGINRLLAVNPLRANWWYDNAVYGLNDASVETIPHIQTGLLRTYATWSLTAVTLLALGGYAAAGVALPSLGSRPRYDALPRARPRRRRGRRVRGQHRTVARLGRADALDSRVHGGDILHSGRRAGPRTHPTRRRDALARHLPPRLGPSADVLRRDKTQSRRPRRRPLRRRRRDRVRHGVGNDGGQPGGLHRADVPRLRRHGGGGGRPQHRERHPRGLPWLRYDGRDIRHRDGRPLGVDADRHAGTR